MVGFCWPANAVGAHTITGCTTDQDGKPVAGVRIRIERQDRDGSHQVQTAKNGCYRYGGLAEGTYRVEAYPRGTLLSPVPQTVDLSHDARVDFTIGSDAKSPPQPPVNEMVISAPCSETWVAILQTIRAPMQLRASDKDAGMLYFASTTRLNEAQSGEAVKSLTTGRFGSIPGVWTDFSVDAVNFALRPVTDLFCSVRIDVAYSARNPMIESIDRNTGRLTLYTNGALETKFLTDLRDAADEHRRSSDPAK